MPPIGNAGSVAVTMQLQELSLDLPAEVRRWAEALRHLTGCSGEQTAAALAQRLHCAPATLSRYLQGQRPHAAFDAVVPPLATLAAERGYQVPSLHELRRLCEQAAQATHSEPDKRPPPSTSSPSRADRNTSRYWKGVWVVAGLLLLVVLLITGLCYVRVDPPFSADPTQEPPPPADQVPPWSCALVNVAESSVLIDPENPTTPLKEKRRNERVRLLDLHPVRTPAGDYQAVLVLQPPRSPTGYGWMLADHLTPAPCDN
jgi:hypothetical protein